MALASLSSNMQLSIIAGAILSVGQLATAAVMRSPSALPASCTGVTAARYAGSVGAGWKAVKVAGSLTSPRGMVWDSAGHLLVVQSGKGIFAYTIGTDGCFSASKQVVTQTNLNHGIAVSADGKTLYASSSTTVFQWTYDAATTSVSGASKSIITGMYNGGHPTRTLALSKLNPNLLVVSHGSNSNFDYPSENPAVGRSIVKVFDLSKLASTPYNYPKDGWNAGYGMRNEIGLIFDGNGMMWGVENSGDNFVRDISGKQTDIHIDNPAEKLNYIGDISKPNDQWYGYPTCFTVWKPSLFPDKKFAVGDQFVVKPNATFDDAACEKKSTPPRLSFQAHSAPIDGVFDKAFSNMYVTFHGSWNRSPATGFKVIQIPFKNGTKGYEPTAAANSDTGYTDIWFNANTGSCGGSQCFRPTGIVADSSDRLYVASDAGEGEIFILGKE